MALHVPARALPGHLLRRARLPRLRDPADRGPAFGDADAGARLRALLDAYGRDAVDAARLLEACALRFAGGYATMRWNAEHLGGGWARMWAAGVGDIIRRRVAWFERERPALAAALDGGADPR